MLLECYYCGTRSPAGSIACSKCGSDYSFLKISSDNWSGEQLHSWLFSEHFQIYERATDCGFESLDDGQKLNYLVGYLYFQVENGGLWQYFFNPCGPDAPLLLEALEKIGAAETAKIVDQALDYFPSRQPPEDMDQRSSIVDAIPEDIASILDERASQALFRGDKVKDKPQEDLLSLLKNAIDKKIKLDAA